jgi:transcription elongation GreA/GreB family factor
MNDKEKINLKNRLRNRAVEILHNRVETSTTAMSEAQLAANEEGKSSVGDKYETSRAMAQIDRDIHARQLESAQKELNFIQQVDVSLFCKHVEVGAYVDGEIEKYFFLTGLGPVDMEEGKIIFLSINSPIGKIFSGKKAGDKVNFNGREILIRDVF